MILDITNARDVGKMKTRILISLLLFVGVLALAHVLPSAEARSFSSFGWNIDESYHRDGHVQSVVQKDSENFLPIEIKGLGDVTVTLHPTINHDQTGKCNLPRGIDIYFEPDVVTLTDGEIKPVKLMINVGENAPSNLYDVQIVGTWKEEDKTSDFMGSSIRLHVGHDFGDGKIPINMLEPPLKFWKLIQDDGGTVDDVPCRNDYVLVVKHDGSPACVKPDSVTKLIERGWMGSFTGVVSSTHNQKQFIASSEYYSYEDLCGFPVTDKMRLKAIHDNGHHFTREGISYFELYPGNFTHITLAENYLPDDPHLNYWFELENGGQMYFRIGACDVEGSDITRFEKRN